MDCTEATQLQPRGFTVNSCTRWCQRNSSPPVPPPPPPHPTPQDTLVLGQDVPRLVALGPNEPLSVWSVPHPV